MQRVDHLLKWKLTTCSEEVTAPSMQASAESRVTRPPHARPRMQAKLAPPTVLVHKAELLNALKSEAPAQASPQLHASMTCSAHSCSRSGLQRRAQQNSITTS
jgi:hypothetical protein